MNCPKTLLSLPPEIRNRIYEFAMNSNGALFYFVADVSSNRKSLFHTNFQSDVHKATDFDQLKFVNRQLYSKTAGLELKRCTSLVFDHTCNLEVVQGAQEVDLLRPISVK
jgi:hypothetical protein